MLLFLLFELFFHLFFADFKLLPDFATGEPPRLLFTLFKISFWPGGRDWMWLLSISLLRGTGLLPDGDLVLLLTLSFVGATISWPAALALRRPDFCGGIDPFRLIRPSFTALDKVR